MILWPIFAIWEKSHATHATVRRYLYTHERNATSEVKISSSVISLLETRYLSFNCIKILRLAVAPICIVFIFCSSKLSNNRNEYYVFFSSTLRRATACHGLRANGFVLYKPTPTKTWAFWIIYFGSSMVRKSDPKSTTAI